MPETLDESVIDSLLGDLSLERDCLPDPDDKDQINFWVPVAKKASYDRLQRATGQKFGKRLKEIIIQAIERADKLHKIP